jgi:hypothetical protein
MQFDTKRIDDDGNTIEPEINLGIWERLRLAWCVLFSLTTEQVAACQAVGNDNPTIYNVKILVNENIRCYIHGLHFVGKGNAAIYIRKSPLHALNGIVDMEMGPHGHTEGDMQAVPSMKT